jgi:hypothetical protein
MKVALPERAVEYELNGNSSSSDTGGYSGWYYQNVLPMCSSALFS